MTNTNPIIEIKNLKKSYGSNCVLNGFNMILNEGENLVIMGKSGSGKSVMIKCLIGLEEADSGTITIMGQEISKLTQEKLIKTEEREKQNLIKKITKLSHISFDK